MENEIDLFEQWEKLPEIVKAIIEHMDQLMESGEWGYDECAHYQNELKQHGYTYDFGLDGEPFNLKKI